MTPHTQTSLIKVGKIKDALGLKGHLKILIFSGDYSWLEKLEILFLAKPSTDMNVAKVEYKVISTRADHKIASVCVEGVTDRTQAESMIGNEIYVDASLFNSSDEEKPYLREILNFKVVDRVHGDIGDIIAFSSNGSQDLLVVEKNGERVEIPFVDAFVKKLERTEKLILVDLPEGLLDINKK